MDCYVSVDPDECFGPLIMSSFCHNQFLFNDSNSYIVKGQQDISFCKRKCESMVKCAAFSMFRSDCVFVEKNNLLGKRPCSGGAADLNLPSSQVGFEDEAYFIKESCYLLSLKN